MGNLITLAAASLIGMSGISASAIGISRNIETAVHKQFSYKRINYNTLENVAQAVFRLTDRKVRQAIETLIKLATASLIDMSDLTVGATSIAHNIADANK